MCQCEQRRRRNGEKRRGRAQGRKGVVTHGRTSFSTHIKAEQVRKSKQKREGRERQSCRRKMVWSLLAVIVGSAVVLYVLYTAVQRSSWLALLWHAIIFEWVLDFVTRTSRPQRILKAVQKNATKGDPESVISAIDHYCRHKEWAMNVGDDKGLILDSVLTEVNPSTALELGTYCGYSTVRIARLLSPGSKLITVEFNPAFAAVARQIIAYAGLQDKITLVEGPSGDLIPKMKERFGIKSFDFVFLDHWKDRYEPDTKLLEDCGLLKKGTVLLADNVICPGTPEYLKYVRNSPRYESRYYKSNLEYSKVEDGLEKSVFLG
ncbi:hypothetical protein QQF64_032580 [Cirrhinus molitorella]|uniref:catechol O-methyltransferase n=2 Tax=Cirrhinus molitorella TaxID=172907 RepID=A0ABR3N0C5_9TELE